MVYQFYLLADSAGRLYQTDWAYEGAPLLELKR